MGSLNYFKLKGFVVYIHRRVPSHVRRMSQRPRAPVSLYSNFNMWQRAAARCSTRRFSSVAPSSHSRVPWFIDSLEPSFTPKTFSPEQPPLPLPLGVPAVLHDLYAQLVQSPYLEPSKLLVRNPIPQPPGPPLPISTPRGRRKRGATYGGEGLLEPGNLWNWIVLAQVRP